MNAAGEKIPPKEIDLHFVQTGITQREEVQQQLAVIDSAYDNPRLFWGRWSESRWGFWWIVGAPCNNCMAGDAGRLWRIKNLLVAFDDKGVVSAADTIGDDKLWLTLHRYIADIHSPTLDLSRPTRIVLTNSDPVAILLHPQTMEFERSDNTKPNLEVPVQNVVRFQHEPIADHNPSHSVTCHKLHVSKKTVLGRKINVCGEPAEIGMMFEYLQQEARADMAWK